MPPWTIAVTQKVKLDVELSWLEKHLSTWKHTQKIRRYVFSILNPETEKGIMAFEMYVYRRKLKIFWTQKITAEDHALLYHPRLHCNWNGKLPRIKRIFPFFSIPLYQRFVKRPFLVNHLVYMKHIFRTRGI